MIVVRWFVLLAGVALPALARATVGGAPVDPPLLAPDVAAHVRESERVGRLLYVLDEASAVGTDVMAVEFKDRTSGAIGGWLTFRDADDPAAPPGGHRVVFLTRDQPPRIPCAVTLPPNGKPVFKRYDPPAPASAEVLRWFAARQAALAARPDNGQQTDPIVLPAEGGTGFVVYLLASTTRPGELVFGIHYRALVSADGKVTEMTPLSKTALIVRDQEVVRSGATVVENVVSHVVTDWPLETHVFVSLLHKKRPIIVVTKKGNWRVVGDRITFLGPPGGGRGGAGSVATGGSALPGIRPVPACPEICAAVSAARCSNGPPDQASCLKGCDRIRSGPCADDFRAAVGCAGATPIFTCDGGGRVVAAGCEAQTSALMSCLARANRPSR